VSLMLDYFLGMVVKKVDSDFTQAMINCFLKAHYDAILTEDTEEGEMIGKVKRLLKHTEDSF